MAIPAATGPAGTAPPEEVSSEPAEATEAVALARRLIVDGDVVLYDPGAEAVVYADRWTQEGTGLGFRVARRVGSTSTSLVEHDPGELREPERAVIVARLAAALDGPSWRALERVPWEDPTVPLIVPEQALIVTFEPPTLSARSPFGTAATPVGTPSATPHRPGPIAVYAAAGVALVVVEIWFDAGAGYAQGYNHYGEHRLLRLR